MLALGASAYIIRVQTFSPTIIHVYKAIMNMYNALIHLHIPFDDNKMIWKMKIPLKTKVFRWYLRRGVILTKDNLAKRN
jgi:hypothetical protein